MLYTTIVMGYMECDICRYCSAGVWSVLYAPIVVGYMEFVINNIYRINVVYKVCYIPLLKWGIWSVIYAPIVVKWGYMECDICP